LVVATILLAALLDGGGARVSMIVGLIVVLFGLGSIALGSLQLSGAVPILRRASTFSACTNVAAGIFLIVLGVLRLKGLL
jgi:hypothetical protein